MHNIPEKAMVLAAGFGKRMQPLTNVVPKPLIPVAGVCLLDRILNSLYECGIKTAVVNSHYKAEILETHLHQRILSHPGQPEIVISHEDTILETGGGIKKALPLLGKEPFFVINGDVLWIDHKTSLTLPNLAAHWNEEKMDALLLLHPTNKAIGYDGQGDFVLANDGHVVRPETVQNLPYVFAGISIVHPRFFDEAPEEAFSLNALYWRARQADGKLARIYGIIHQGEWLHVGTPEGLNTAETFLMQYEEPHTVMG